MYDLYIYNIYIILYFEIYLDNIKSNINMLNII